MKIKYYLTIILSVICVHLCSSVVKAQVADGISPATITRSSSNIVDFISGNPLLRASATNWTIIPYVTHARGLTDSKGKSAEWGGGLAALYPILGDVKVGPRIQYLAGNFYTLSATVQYSPSYKLFGSPVIVTPAAYTGVMFPFAGAGADNGNLSAVYGAGVSFKYPFTEKLEAGIGYGWEDWTGLKVKSVEHYALVLNWKF